MPIATADPLKPVVATASESDPKSFPKPERDRGGRSWGGEDGFTDPLSR